ncbi:exonuclease domain-containing protein [Oceanicella sp. SM1341]|uniref:exonuclease domain-containing protein n=1 Tax=Oceanicella sp. SM1341 TaxID=1548889 RepID=UPI001E2D16A1|nr:exonuclease domain-containing protein [Oceanicella sp. SM1341]
MPDARQPFPPLLRAGGRARLPELPAGPFRFVALDVETANHDRASICQVGVAFVRPHGEIDCWVSYVDPGPGRWAFTGLHGIGPDTVAGAPGIGAVLDLLGPALRGLTVYQHSGFDRSALRAACTVLGRPEPDWEWQNSVSVARRAWPELKGNGGHGLASLRGFLGLRFEHHDAGEDARAAAEVVLHAERLGAYGAVAGRTGAGRLGRLQAGARSITSPPAAASRAK